MGLSESGGGGPSVSTPLNVFRDGFSTQNTNNWNFANVAASDLIYVGGNTASASWVSICKSALVADTYSEIVSQNSYPLSILAAAGLSVSQSPNGQAMAFDIVGVDNNGNIVNNATIPDIALANVAASVTSNVVTFTVASPPITLLPGDPIVIFGCSDSRLNFGPTVVSSVNLAAGTFTVANAFRTTAVSLANGSYTVGAAAFVRFAPHTNYSSFIEAVHFAQGSTASTDAVHCNGDRQPEVLFGIFSNAMTATIPNEGGLNYANLSYSYPQRNTTELSIRGHNKYAQFLAVASDSVNLPSTQRRTQNIPDASRNYKIRFRVRNFPNHMVPVGPITAAAKSASTTATLTIPAHGLTTNDWIAIVGIRDQTNFVDTTTATQVASVVDANTITIVFGASATATSYGGFVYRVQGQATTAPTTTTSAIQNYAATADLKRLSVVFLATQGATIIPGEVWTLYGLVDSTNTNHPELAGRYRVESSNTTTFTVELTPLDGQNVAAVSVTPANAGGGLIRNTELRLHFFRLETEMFQSVEIQGAVGNSDFQNAIPVTTSSASISGTVTANQGTGISTSQWSAAGWGGFLVADVASAAITTTTTTAAISPGSVVNVGVYAHSFNVVVTVVSGTTPTMDVGVEESIDNGTNWVRIYDFPRITATGAYTSPELRNQHGTRYRYVQTIAGTTPSFTRAVNRLEMSDCPPLYRQFIDRAINFNSLNSTTVTWQTAGSDTLQMFVNCGAITTTAPQFQLQGSEDKGTTWYNIGAAVTAVASSTVVGTIQQGIMADQIRVLETVAGSGATIGANGIMVKAYGR